MIEFCFVLFVAGNIPEANLYFEIDLQAENIKAVAYSQEDKQLIIRLLCPPEIEIEELVVMK